jgi:hypothetical protein
MPTAFNILPNSVALKRAYFGTEAIAGVAVPPTYRVYANFMLRATRALADREEFGGTLYSDYTPVFGPWEIDGTMEQPLTYEDLAIFPRYSLKGGGTGVTDGNPTPGYTYARSPHATALDIDSATVEGGTPDMPWTGTGVIFPEFTISADIDDAEAVWKWSSPVKAVSRDLKATTTGIATGGTTSTVVKTAAGWTINQFAGAYVTMTGGTAANIGQSRLISSNTATELTVATLFPAAVVASDAFTITGTFTTGIADRTREMIAAPGTDLYIDTTTIGTTAVTGKFISFSVTYQSGLNSFKRFMENISTFTAKPDLGKRRVMGQIRMEFDSTSEYQNFVNATARKIRIEQTGSAINVGPNTFKLARIDIPNAVWSEVTEDERNSNITATFGFRGFVDTVSGVPFTLTAKNTLATLP